MFKSLQEKPYVRIYQFYTGNLNNPKFQYSFPLIFFFLSSGFWKSLNGPYYRVVMLQDLQVFLSGLSFHICIHLRIPNNSISICPMEIPHYHMNASLPLTKPKGARYFGLRILEK